MSDPDRNMLGLELRDLTISFGTNPLFAPLSFSLRPGEVLSIIGQSGVGKTSMLRAIAGAMPAAKIGHLAKPEPSAMVFQEDRLFPWCDLISNILAPVKLRRNTTSADRDRAHFLLNALGLEKEERMIPSEVSGGMRQRVAIARALMESPALLMLDEPFASLDFDTKIVAQRLLQSQMAKTGCVTLLVTHDIDDAVSLSSKIIQLRPHPVDWIEHRIDWRDGPIDPIEARQQVQQFELVKGILGNAFG